MDPAVFVTERRHLVAIVAFDDLELAAQVPIAHQLHSVQFIRARGDLRSGVQRIGDPAAREQVDVGIVAGHSDREEIIDDDLECIERKSENSA